jgi:predicted N-acetyltransferase YhbS
MIMRHMSIRQAKIGDLQRIMALTRRAYRIPYRKSAFVIGSHEPNDIVGDFRRKGFFAFVAVVGDKIVGAVRYKKSGNALYLYKLAVLKTFRNRGVGSALVKKVEEAAKRAGCGKVLLDCAREKKLPGYYKRMGYETDGIKKHLDHHDVFMSKRIGGR